MRFAPRRAAYTSLVLTGLACGAIAVADSPTSSSGASDPSTAIELGPILVIPKDDPLSRADRDLKRLVAKLPGDTPTAEKPGILDRTLDYYLAHRDPDDLAPRKSTRWNATCAMRSPSHRATCRGATAPEPPSWTSTAARRSAPVFRRLTLAKEGFSAEYRFPGMVSLPVRKVGLVVGRSERPAEDFASELQ